MNIILKLRKMSTITKQRPILNIYTGPMFAGKTTRLIKHFNSIEVDNELEKISTLNLVKILRYETNKDQDNTDILREENDIFS